MKVFALPDLEAGLSAMIANAERGKPTILTKDGRHAAMIVPMEAGRSLFPDTGPSFADLLLSMPEGLDIERDPRPLRGIDL